MKNISKIISITFLSFSILLLCYVFYRSELYHSGRRFDYYLKYYFISFSFIAMSIISFFLGKDIKIKISILLISTLFALYLVEGYLIINNINPENIPWITREKIKVSKKLGIEFDDRSKYQVYQDLKKKDPNTVLLKGTRSEIYINGQKIYNFGGISNRKTILCNENGYYSIYQSDRYGFNNPDTEWDKNEIEFLLVGDSFVHGYCVNEPDTIGGNLRSKLDNKKVGVINLGIAGFGPLAEYATLREYMNLTNTKRVIWMYTEANDIIDFNTEKNNKILLNYFNNKKFTQNLHLKQKIIDEILIESLSIYEKKYKSRFFKLYNLRVLTFGRWKNLLFNMLSYKISPPPLSVQFEELFSKSKKFVESKGAKLYFVYLPAYDRPTNYKNSENNEIQYYQKVIQIIKDLNIPIIDLHVELFEKQKDPLSFYSFRLPSHYTESGYELIANIIFNKIEEFEK